MSWMTRFDWRTCKRAEADVIRDYFYERWIQGWDTGEQEPDQDLESDRQYRRMRDAADRCADRFR
jgi:hypothetical protein